MADRVFLVVANTRLPNGGQLLHARKSREIQRLSTCRRVLKRMQRTIPDAFIVQVTRFC